MTTDMILTRVFNATPAQLFTAWSDANLIKRWWGPKGFTCPLANVNFHEGGTTLVCMHMPNIFEIYNTWNYTKIVPHQRIEYALRFSDKDGKTIAPMMPGIPEEVPHVIEFKDLGNGQTELTVSEYGYTHESIANQSKLGMSECLDKMATIFDKK